MGFSITNKTIYKDWTNLKAVITDKFDGDKGKIQFDERDDRYYIFILDNNIEYFTELWIDTSQVDGIDVSQNNTDKTDFESNYKNFANVAEEPKDEVGTPSVGIPRYSPRLYQTDEDIEVVASAEETILDISGNGQLDFISLNLEGKKWEVILEVDGIEIYRLDIIKLDAIHKLVTVTNYTYTSSSAVFTDMYPTPVDFTSNVKIKVKNLDSATKDVKAVFMRYRVRI